MELENLDNLAQRGGKSTTDAGAVLGMPPEDAWLKNTFLVFREMQVCSDHGVL